jgi:hypothetical protein
MLRNSRVTKWEWGRWYVVMKVRDFMAGIRKAIKSLCKYLVVLEPTVFKCGAGEGRRRSIALIV